MLNQPAVAALNHLLAQSGWALPRLAKFNGKTVRFELPLFSFICTIQSDGSLLAAATDADPDAACLAPPALLPRLALLDESARNLRWDATDDLSRVMGDIAAERVVRFAEGAQRMARQNALHLTQALAEYWTEERPLIAASRNIASFSHGVSRLQSSLDTLERRIDQLSKAG